MLTPNLVQHALPCGQAFHSWRETVQWTHQPS